MNVRSRAGRPGAADASSRRSAGRGDSSSALLGAGTQVGTGASTGTGGDDPTAQKVLLVTTQGGHLAQMLSLRAWWTTRQRVWIAPATEDVADRLVGERVITSHSPTTRNVGNLLRNIVLAWQVVRRERPDVVVSAGAGVAVPFFVIAWLMGIPTIFVEVYDRFDSPTLTGRLCGPFATRRIVQWDTQLDVYPDAVVVGPLL